MELYCLFFAENDNLMNKWRRMEWSGYTPC